MVVYIREDLVNFTDFNFAIPLWESPLVVSTIGEGEGIPLNCKIYNMLRTNYMEYDFGQYNIDKTPPVTESNVAIERDVDNVNTGAIIRLKAGDALSGVVSITYQIDSDEPTFIPGDCVDISLLKNANITYYATDIAGNCEIPRLITISDIGN